MFKFGGAEPTNAPCGDGSSSYFLYAGLLKYVRNATIIESSKTE